MPTVSLSTPAAKTTINPITGIFGSGRTELIFKDGTFTAPITGRYRIRVWGAGGEYVGFLDATSSYYRYIGGAGGGFAMLEVSLNEGDIVSVTVAKSELGNTTSFGSYVSATSAEKHSGYKTSLQGGVGIGGTINTKGGASYENNTASNAYGAGSASIMGDGGPAGGEYTNVKTGSTAGLGSGSDNSFLSGIKEDFANSLKYGLDFIGAGRGSSATTHAGTGGGGGNQIAGFPGGGGSQQSKGANGLVTVEY